MIIDNYVHVLFCNVVVFAKDVCAKFSDFNGELIHDMIPVTPCNVYCGKLEKSYLIYTVCVILFCNIH